MVDQFLPCTRIGCDGVAVAEGDLRSKNVKYKCRKCGHTFTILKSNVDAGKYTFKLNDPNDPLRGGLK